MLNKKETRVVTQLADLLSVTTELNEKIADFLNPAKAQIKDIQAKDIQTKLDKLQDTIIRTNNAVSDLLVPYKRG